MRNGLQIEDPLGIFVKDKRISSHDDSQDSTNGILVEYGGLRDCMLFVYEKNNNQNSSQSLNFFVTYNSMGYESNINLINNQYMIQIYDPNDEITLFKCFKSEVNKSWQKRIIGNFILYIGKLNQDKIFNDISENLSNPYSILSNPYVNSNKSSLSGNRSFANTGNKIKTIRELRKNTEEEEIYQKQKKLLMEETEKTIQARKEQIESHCLKLQEAEESFKKRLQEAEESFKKRLQEAEEKFQEKEKRLKEKEESLEKEYSIIEQKKKNIEAEKESMLKEKEKILKQREREVEEKLNKLFNSGAEIKKSSQRSMDETD